MNEIDYICDLALRFSEVNRTGVYLHNGQPESDTDHTVMLGWIACSFAAKHYPELDLGLIAQFALVHDSPEIYAGDVQSLGMDANTAKAKKEREAQAVDRLNSELQTYTWLVDLLNEYEKQIMPEARFVRAIDKVLPKIVAFINDLVWVSSKFDFEELQVIFGKQINDIRAYAGEFEKLLELYQQTAFRIIKGIWKLSNEMCT